MCVYAYLFAHHAGIYNSFEELDIEKNELCALWDDFDCVYLKWHECDRDFLHRLRIYGCMTLSIHFICIIYEFRDNRKKFIALFSLLLKTYFLCIHIRNNSVNLYIVYANKKCGKMPVP